MTPDPPSPPARSGPWPEERVLRLSALEGGGEPIRRPAASRLTAFVEVVLCSGFPTQVLLIALLATAGYSPTNATGELSFGYVVTLLLCDAVLLVGLVFLFLRLHGESASALFFGGRRTGREAVLGLITIPVILVFVMSVLAALRSFSPWLHNVERNPLEDLIQTPVQALVFGLVALVAGGLREEIQRAFVLRRFEQHLGGALVGVVVFSTVFGAGHLLQGYDAAVATALLGVIWGVLYLSRRSIVAPVVSHAGFNLAEIIRFTIFR